MDLLSNLTFETREQQDLLDSFGVNFDFLDVRLVAKIYEIKRDKILASYEKLDVFNRLTHWCADLIIHLPQCKTEAIFIKLFSPMLCTYILENGGITNITGNGNIRQAQISSPNEFGLFFNNCVKLMRDSIANVINVSLFELFKASILDLSDAIYLLVLQAHFTLKDSEGLKIDWSKLLEPRLFNYVLKEGVKGTFIIFKKICFQETEIFIQQFLMVLGKKLYEENHIRTIKETEEILPTLSYLSKINILTMLNVTFPSNLHFNNERDNLEDSKNSNVSSSNSSTAMILTTINDSGLSTSSSSGVIHSIYAPTASSSNMISTTLTFAPRKPLASLAKFSRFDVVLRSAVTAGELQAQDYFKQLIKLNLDQAKELKESLKIPEMLEVYVENGASINWIIQRQEALLQAFTKIIEEHETSLKKKSGVDVELNISL